MARPTDKAQLLALSEQNYIKMFSLIDSLPPEAMEQTFSFEDRDRNIRDVLVHLYEWHLMMLGWYQCGMAGGKPVMPAEGYTWRTLPELNRAIWKKYQDMSLATARKGLDETHQQIQSMIAGHSEEELFTKKYYLWTGSTSLAAYFISATSSHYDWALKKLTRFKKNR